MINIGKKILDQVDVPTNSRIISENNDKLIIERGREKSSWKGKIKGIDSFLNSMI